MRNPAPFGTVVVELDRRTPKTPTTRDRLGAQSPWTGICPIALPLALGKKAMAQHNEPDRSASALAPDVSSEDRTPDDVAIFSAPALGVVFHWWIESNRRWAELNRRNPLNIDPLVLPDARRAVAVNSD
jgi:hypothetical protein